MAAPIDDYSVTGMRPVRRRRNWPFNYLNSHIWQEASILLSKGLEFTFFMQAGLANNGRQASS